ncbi:LamG-like jellyroll fold domain-containing protein [Aquipuribacter hungaricus]|uniref:LamG-like jellyroll fold domain-containing protein n=1 Tax=Aquipuribacter hungaricus TaxID=545624 RepID=A0ABV7WFI0_9MICO
MPRPPTAGPRPRRRPAPRTAALATAVALVLGGLVSGAGPATAAAPAYEKKVPPLATRWTAEVGPANALPEYPRPQLTRERWQNLNGVWQLREPSRFGDGLPFGEDLEERVLVPYPVESALSGIQRSMDRMWYRRTFEVPAGWGVGTRATQQRLVLHFGAVDYDATVYVNGRRATGHRGGYDKFSVDVTDLLTRSGPQELVVGVEDLTDQTWQPVGKQRERGDGGIFYQGSSGIWQTVWMEPRPAAAVESVDLVPDVDTSSVAVTVQVPGASRQRVDVVATERGTGRVVGRVTGAPNVPLTLPMPGAGFWTPDTPTLYDLRVRVLDRTRVVDSVGSYVGLREIAIAPGEDGRNRITLNGEVLFHNATLDQGFWPDGLSTAPTDEALRSDLELHKELGFNTVRKHIKVEPDRWYHHADELGLMVWQDMPSMRTGGRPPVAAQQQFEAELDEMVREKKSWTSIVAWVPMNEGWGEWSREETGRLADEVKAQDPTRLVDAHSGVNCCDSLGDSGRGDIVDFHQYVGPASPQPDATRAAVDGEHGGLGLKTGAEHEWFKDGRSFAYELTTSSEQLTDRYVQVARDLQSLASSCALSGSIYTQLTDVEAEVNGFVTYDREVEKMDFARVRAVNEEVTASADGTGGPRPDPGPGTPGLEGVGSWPADEGTGDVAEDVVGDADLSLRGGATWSPGRTGAGLQLDGTDDWAETAGPVVDTTGSFSVAAWVKLDREGFFTTAVAQDGPVRSAFFLQKTGPENRFAFSTASQRALGTEAPVVGRWYHLVGTRDVSTGEYVLYVDGQRQGSFTSCAAGDVSDGPLTVGRAKFDGRAVDPWPGALDQVHAYDRALGAAEVAELFASGR